MDYSGRDSTVTPGYRSSALKIQRLLAGDGMGDQKNRVQVFRTPARSMFIPPVPHPGQTRRAPVFR